MIICEGGSYGVDAVLREDQNVAHTGVKDDQNVIHTASKEAHIFVIFL